MSRGKRVACAALLLAVATSLVLLHPHIQEHLKTRWTGCSNAPQNDAFRTDSHLLTRLSSGPSLVQLTDARESASDVLLNLKSYRALVVVTAGRGEPTRRAEHQPFISLATSELTNGFAAAAVPTDGAAVAASSVLSGIDGAAAAASSGLPALASTLGLMNTAAVGVERVLGRRLFPISLALFDRPVGCSSLAGPYAVFDASAGVLLLDRQLVSYTWGADRPEVSYITGQLASRVFGQMSGLLPLRGGASRGGAGSGTGGGSAAGVSEPTTDNDVGGGGGVAMDTEGEGVAALLAGLVGRSGAVSEAAELQPQQQQQLLLQSSGVQLARQLSDQGVRSYAVSEEDAGAEDAGQEQLFIEDDDAPRGATAGTAATAAAAGRPALASSGGGAAAALHVAAAALAAALPAAFAAAPPLWFCVLCPSVLGLLAPLVINMALNQVAGALCSQMQLTDDVCFDVLLGALGVGFVLSLASAVPIFFVCRLPECAGRNVTAALRQMMRRD